MDDFKKLVEKEKALMKQICKCQRNWDFSKEIPKEHIDYLNWVACNTPSFDSITCVSKIARFEKRLQ